MKRLFFTIFLISLIQFSVVAYAQAEAPLPGPLEQVMRLLGTPVNWLTWPGFIWRFLVPFIGVWAIVLGFMRVIGIFRNQPKLEVILSFAIAFMTIPPGWFFVVVNVLFASAGMWATLAFVALFILGVGLYAYKRGIKYWEIGWRASEEFKEFKEIEGKIKKLEFEKIKLMELARKHPDKYPKVELNKKLSLIDKQITTLKNLRAEIARH